VGIVNYLTALSSIIQVTIFLLFPFDLKKTEMGKKYFFFAFFFFTVYSSKKETNKERRVKQKQILA
jgi:hypothetical protein